MTTFEPRGLLEHFREGQTAAAAHFGQTYAWMAFFAAPNVLTWGTLTTPPGSPSNGDAHLVSMSSPTGAWASHGGKLALALSGDWLFRAPVPGLRVYRVDAAAPQNEGQWIYGNDTDGWYPDFRWWTVTEHWTGRYIGRAGTIATSPSKVWRKVVDVPALPASGVLNTSYGGGLSIDLRYPIHKETPKLASTAMGNQLPAPAPIGLLPVDVIEYSASFDIVVSVNMSSYAGSFMFEYVKTV